jgi:hypothetical protein
MRGLLIVNDAPPPMAPEWHPDPNEFHLVEPPSAADTVREWHQMAPTVGVPTVTASEEQPLYLDFLPGVCGAGDENRTRVLGLGRAVRRTRTDQRDPLGQVIALAAR